MAQNIDQVMMYCTIYPDEYEKAKKQIVEDLMGMVETRVEGSSEPGTVNVYPVIPLIKVLDYLGEWHE